jgi:hypothetical protein
MISPLKAINPTRAAPVLPLRTMTASSPYPEHSEVCIRGATRNYPRINVCAPSFNSTDQGGPASARPAGSRLTAH